MRALHKVENGTPPIQIPDANDSLIIHPFSLNERKEKKYTKTLILAFAVQPINIMINLYFKTKKLFKIYAKNKTRKRKSI